MPTIEVSMFEGRTVDQKRQMAKAVTSAICTTLSVPEEAVTIIIREMAKVNYAKAGKLKCDERPRLNPRANEELKMKRTGRYPTTRKARSGGRGSHI